MAGSSGEGQRRLRMTKRGGNDTPRLLSFRTKRSRSTLNMNLAARLLSEHPEALAGTDLEPYKDFSPDTSD